MVHWVTQLVSPDLKGNCPGLAPGGCGAVCRRSPGGRRLTVPPPCPWQSGQAYYINDGESVNLFEWMAPLVGAQMPTPTCSPCQPSLLPKHQIPFSKPVLETVSIG